MPATRQRRRSRSAFAHVLMRAQIPSPFPLDLPARGPRSHHGEARGGEMGYAGNLEPQYIVPTVVAQRHGKDVRVSWRVSSWHRCIPVLHTYRGCVAGKRCTLKRAGCVVRCAHAYLFGATKRHNTPYTLAHADVRSHAHTRTFTCNTPYTLAHADVRSPCVLSMHACT